MSHKYAMSTLTSISLILIVGVLSLAWGWGVARIIMALPLVLLLPSGAVTYVCFPGRTVSGAERLLFSLGLSLAIVALGGLVLHLTPWGLHPVPWTVLLGGITVAAGGGVRMRRPDRTAITSRTSRGLTVPQVAICGLAALVLLGAGFVTVRGAQDQTTVGFTQLWLLPADADPMALNLGVTNNEPAATTGYRLQFEVDSQVRAAWDVQLTSGATWTRTVTLPTDVPANAAVEAVLYRADSPETVYRRVKIQRGQ